MAINMADKFAINDLIFVPDEEEGYVPAEVAAEFKRGEEGQVRLTTRNNFVRRVSKDESMLVERMDAQSYRDVTDMINLNLLNNASLLYNLRKRYCEKDTMEIYTNIGAILVAINPYMDLGLYNQPYEDKYLNSGTAITGMEPHIFKVAESAFNNMKLEDKDQSCVITGESGAGKTETTKRFLQYVSEKSKRNREATGADFGIDTEKLRTQILDSNPFMEAFGNAKTIRNDNSSRFGKLIEMYFDTSKGVVVGANITSYLLEKSRVVKVSAGERNYHIFYQLCAASAASSHPDFTKGFNLQAADSFNYTKGDNMTLQDVEIDGVNDAEILEETINAMTKLGLTEEDIKTTFSICSAILHVGNIEFDGAAKDLAELKEGVIDTALSYSAELLGVEEKALEQAILERSLRGTDVKRHTVQEATAARDALSKFVYSKLFDWLIGKMNVAMSTKSKGKTRQKLRLLGVLDIFGFETFAINSFEQMCINFCNEKLQGFFNYHVFKKEQQEYRDEGINFKNVGFSDNQGVIDTFEKGPKAVMVICDDLCNLEQSTDASLLNKILGNAVEQKAKNAHLKFLFKPKIQEIRRHKHLATAFCIKHYAGFINYNVEKFLEKNKDQLRRDIRTCLAGSSCKLIKGLFPDGGDVGGGKQKNFKNTLSTKFRNSLDRLMRRLNGTTPQFVRCIKPNDTKVPGEFDHKKIYKQLNEAGLLEVCRIRKLGYPVHKTHREFMNSYLCLDRTAKNLEDLEQKLMEKGILFGTDNNNNWQIGKTKVFLRSEQLYVLEQKRGEALKETLRIIQSVTRKFLFRVKVKKALKAIKRIQRGMADRNPEVLEQGLNFFMEKGPLFAKLPIVIDGLRTMKGLQGQLDIIKELQEAMDKRDYNTMKVKIDLASQMGFTHEILKEAQRMLDEYETDKEVLKKLEAAMISKDIAQLEAAVKHAKACKKTDSEIYKQAATLLETLKNRASRLEELTKALERDDLDVEELKRLIMELRSFGLSADHPLIFDAARRGDIIMERGKKREKKIKNLEKQLERYIRKKNLKKLKELVRVAVELKYTGDLVTDAMELISHLQQRQELLDEVSNASRVLQEKAKMPDGLTEQDLVPLKHAIKIAVDVPDLELDQEIQVLEGNKLLERAQSQIVVQEEITVVLNKENKGKYDKMLEKVQQLGLQTRDADALVQKVRERDLFEARKNAINNEEVVKQLIDGLVVPSPAERKRHLVGRMSDMYDEDFTKLSSQVAASSDFIFDKYYRIRSDADYVSKERRKNKASRKKLKFAYEPDRPISKSLVELDDLQDVIAVQINQTIHKYCDGLSGNRKENQQAAMSFVVEYGICDKGLADEIYLQLAKHLRGNENRLSKKNAWNLLSLCATYFPTSRGFLPFMVSYLQGIVDEMGIEGNYARYVLAQLSASLSHDPVEVNFKPGPEEIHAFFLRPPILLQLENLDGTYTNIPIPPDYSLRSAAPIIREGTGIKINLKKPEWAVFVRSLSKPKKRTYKQRLEAFYNQYKPENLGNIDQILAYYKGREASLFTTLVKQDGYGAEPEVDFSLALQQKKYKKQAQNDDDASSVFSSASSVFSVSSVSSAASRVSRGVSTVFRRMRGLSTVDLKDLDKPTPKAAWPLAWGVRIGSVANNIFSQGYVPVFYYKRRLLRNSQKPDESVFFQLKTDYIQGYLFAGEDNQVAYFSSILLCESLLRRGKEVPYSNPQNLKRAGFYNFFPKPMRREKRKMNKWWDLMCDVAAEKTTELEDLNVEDLQNLFIGLCKKLETYGKCFFFAQVLDASTKSYIAKAQTPLDKGKASIAIGPNEVLFFDEFNQKTASFKTSDLTRCKLEGSILIIQVKKELKKNGEKKKSDRMSRTKSLRKKAGNALRGAMRGLIGAKSTKIQLYTLQRREIADLISYYQQLPADSRL